MLRSIPPARRRELILIVSAVIILVLLAYYSSVVQTRAAAEQPLEFNHQAMVQLGIDCLFCHTDATRSIAAGMPSEQKCIGCHNAVDTDKPEIQKLAGYWQRQEPLAWVRVNALPRFVYFSHQVHIASGLNCERCHGNVGKMAIAVPVVKMNMGWCLSCHKEQPNAAQLEDCIVCHQ
jgi:c(7)-type cytochrome triheme protein